MLWQHSNSGFVVCTDYEDNRVKLAFRRSDTPVVAHLFEVVIECPTMVVGTYCVLAETPENAIAQARCASGFDGCNGYMATAEQVPLLVQGWDSTKF